jgi:hypothetical protein
VEILRESEHEPSFQWARVSVCDILENAVHPVEDKLAFLQNRARLGYLIAEPFEVPERFHTTIVVGREARKMPVGHVTMLQTLDSPIALFEDALKTLEKRFPAQSDLSIPQDPLVCTTPLMQNSRNVIEPRISGQIRY